MRAMTKYMIPDLIKIIYLLVTRVFSLERRRKGRDNCQARIEAIEDWRGRRIGERRMQSRARKI